MTKAKSVNEYIENAPKEIQGRLNTIRKLIKENAPKAEEKISYGMPYYGYKGRLVYFAYAKSHIGFYGMPYALDELKDEIKKYRTGMATIRLANDEKLPEALIKKIVKMGVKKNDEKSK